MATFTRYGYSPGDVVIEGGGSTLVAGSVFHVDPTWDATTDRLTFVFTDDEAALDGDVSADETGVDANQYLTVRDASGATLASGRAYSEEYAVLTAPDGSTVWLDRIEIGGQFVGYVTNVELQPGVVYTVSNVYNVDSPSATTYFDLAVLDYDPDLASYIRGGAGDDTLLAGAGNDTIEAGAGADSIEGGSGNDTIYFGQGGATSLEGDTVHGGDGADLIDDVGGVSYAYNAVIYGDAGADTVWAGNGDDWIDGGADNDELHGELGDDTITGGTGDDVIWTGDGSDTVVYADGSGADTINDFNMTDDGSGLTTDQFDVTGLTDQFGNPVNAWDVTVTDDGFGNAVLSFPNGESVTLTGVSTAQVSTVQQLYAMGIPCFAEGTLIDTEAGARRIEDLRVGDRIRVRDGPPEPLVWRGARQLGPSELAADPRLLPIRIRAGAFGNAQALIVSGQHAIWVPEAAGPEAGQGAGPGTGPGVADRRAQPSGRGQADARPDAVPGGGALVRARHLAQSGWGGARVMRGTRAVSYHHILLPRHRVIRANGVWCESFWPGPFALGGLTRAGRLGVIAAMPELLSALSGAVPVSAVYGPMAAPLLSRRSISRESCRKWSQLLSDMAFCGSSGRETVTSLS